MDAKVIKELRSFSGWLWDNDRLKLTPQLPPFEDSDKMVDYYLRNKNILDDQAYKRFDPKKMELVIGISKFHNCGYCRIKSALVMCNYSIEGAVDLLRSNPWQVGSGFRRTSCE